MPACRGEPLVQRTCPGSLTLLNLEIDVCLPEEFRHRQWGLRDPELKDATRTVVVRELRLKLRVLDPSCGVSWVELWKTSIDRAK